MTRLIIKLKQLLEFSSVIEIGEKNTIIKFSKRKIFGAVFIALLTFTTVFTLQYDAFALECQKYGTICGQKNPNDNPVACSQYDSGAQFFCCFWKPYPKCRNVNFAGCACKNIFWVCPGGGGGGGGGGPPPCSCTPNNCPNYQPTKFRTERYQSGSGNSCNGCTSVPTTCYNYRNSAPTCSFSTSSVNLIRGVNTQTVNLTVHDSDYGDTVKVKKYSITNANGLANCVGIKTTAGASLGNLTVKAGSNNSGDVNQITSLVFDPLASHGIYTNNGSGSHCTGTLSVTIIDPAAESGDSQGEATCTLTIDVTNQAPTISKVSIFDKDPDTSITPTPDRGDLIKADGSGSPLYVGSTVDSKKAYKCAEGLSQINPITCPPQSRVSVATRRNPFLFELTINDANGANDILQAGVWIQSSATATPPAAIQYPLAASSTRYSFQALYSELENTNTYYRARACLLSYVCPQLNITTSDKQSFTGLAFINDLGSNTSINGNVMDNKHQRSSFRQWQLAGYPDCIPDGCTVSNVPPVSQSNATTNINTPSNYDWAISADKDHLVCYHSNNQVPEVVLAGNPVKCPSNCAACAQKIGTTQVSSTAITFQYLFFLNDKDAPAVNGITSDGMPSAEYRIFVSALDKVGATLYSVPATTSTDDGWIKFDKSGNPCTTQYCGGNPANDFKLIYDTVPPVISATTFQQTLDSVTATLNLSDTSSSAPIASGLAGVTTRFMFQQQLIEGVPVDETLLWLKKALNGTEETNGKDDHIAASLTTSFTGYNPNPDYSVAAGACVYDKAGNMRCTHNGSIYIYQSPWLKTSLGDVYSNTDTGSPFVMTVRSNPEDHDNTATSAKYLYSPFDEQTFTVATGVMLTGSHVAAFGITGGFLDESMVQPVNKLLGFKQKTPATAYYRTAEEGDTPFNIYNYPTISSNNDYDRLHSIALMNCDLLNVGATNTCTVVSSGGLENDMALTSPIKIITIGGSTTVNNLSCSNINIIFVTGTLTITGDVKKTDIASGCLFIVQSGAQLIIRDTPSDSRVTGEPDGKSGPKVDLFEASVVVSAGGRINVEKGTKGTHTGTMDRLQLYGFIYSANATNVPLFARTLVPVDNSRYPSEWIVYDTTTLDIFRSILGTYRTVDLICGISDHILCH